MTITPISKNLVVLILFAISIFFLYQSLSSIASTDKIPIEKHESIYFNFEVLSSFINGNDRVLYSESIRKPRIMIFILHEPICSNCLNEAEEYISIVRTDTLFSKFEIIGIIITEDLKKTDNLLKMSGVGMNFFLFYETTKLKETLVNFKNNGMYFYNSFKNKIFYSALISNSVSTPKSKYEILNRVLVAEINSANQ